MNYQYQTYVRYACRRLLDKDPGPTFALFYPQLTQNILTPGVALTQEARLVLKILA